MVRMFSDPSDCRKIETEELPGIPNYSYVCFDQLGCSKTPNAPVWVSHSKGKKGNRGKLSCRAKIMHPEGADRIRVQYSNGSSYAVHTHLLEAILQETNQIVVYPETDLYRRGCVIHTGEEDAFVEIGCGDGITCDRVKKSGAESRAVWGIDKSDSCIESATKKFPNCNFSKLDVLETSSLPDTPDVVAIDINGNRELDAVLQVLSVTVTVWKPHLVLVKSRTLYHGLKLRNPH